METLIVVSTCPRQVDYLRPTIESLERAGARDYPRVILCDGDVQELEGNRFPWPLLARLGPFKSSRNNLWRALRMASAKSVDRLLYFEDDLTACTNAVHRMAHLEIPADVAFVTCHDVKEQKPGSKPGLHVPRDAHGREGTGFWGAQALVLPLRTLQYLAPLDPFAVWKSSRECHGDRTLEHYVSLSPWPRFGVHIPCLVKHVGAVSEAHPGKELARRQTSNWPGEDFDALSLEF